MEANKKKKKREEEEEQQQQATERDCGKSEELSALDGGQGCKSKSPAGSGAGVALRRVSGNWASPSVDWSNAVAVGKKCKAPLGRNLAAWVDRRFKSSAWKCISQMESDPPFFFFA